MAKKRTGRPQSPDAKKANFMIRCTAAEKSLFFRAAASDKRDASTWARVILEAAARKQLGE